MGSSKIWIIVGAVGIVVLGGWFFMSGGEEAVGASDEPAGTEGSESVEDQDTDGADDAAGEEEEDGGAD